VINNANILARKIRSENGVQNAVDAFYRHLPLKNMLCDISVGMGEAKLAQVCHTSHVFTLSELDGFSSFWLFLAVFRLYFR
jgi:hypothetical protein